MDHFTAFFAAASVVFVFTVFALDEQEMTGLIRTINMGIGRLTTLVTFGYDLICDSLAQPVVKYKILSVKFTGKPFFSNLVCIINDASFQVENIFKAPVEHISA